jgi:hypothetical protein
MIRVRDTCKDEVMPENEIVVSANAYERRHRRAPDSDGIRRSLIRVSSCESYRVRIQANADIQGEIKQSSGAWGRNVRKMISLGSDKSGEQREMNSQMTGTNFFRRQ